MTDQTQALAELREQVAVLARELDEARVELTHVDEVLARRPALDLATRCQNIEKAISWAKRADALQQEVDEARAILKEH